MRISLKKVLDRIKEYGIQAMQAKDRAVNPQEHVEFRAKAMAANEIIARLAQLGTDDEARSILEYLKKREDATYEHRFLRGEIDG